MDKFFEITLTYYDIDENSTSMKIKKFTNVIACEAVNYTEAEALATKWGEENINVEFEISPIKELFLIVKQKLNHTYLLIPAIKTVPFYKTNKNDQYAKNNKRYKQEFL